MMSARGLCSMFASLDTRCDDAVPCSMTCSIGGSDLESRVVSIFFLPRGRQVMILRVSRVCILVAHKKKLPFVGYSSYYYLV
jgi:hypothetical protein